VAVITSGAQIEVCRSDLRPAALALLYSRVPVALRRELVAQALAQANRGDVDLSGLWIAQIRSGQVVGALLTQALPGKAVALWAPEVGSSWRRGKLAAALVETVLAELKGQGFRLAQAVLDEAASPRAGRDLARGGMPRVTQLLYLERGTATPMGPSRRGVKTLARGLDRSSDSPFQWCSLSAVAESAFRTALQGTYVGSLDMPELDCVRVLDDIIASHKAAGRFVADRWRLGWIPAEPGVKAVVLLAEVPQRESWEVVYLGLTPMARGRGLGRFVVAHALELAQAHVPRLELAVDCRNEPAIRLYESTGFVVRERRAVHLAVLGQGSG
jgi:mycothiol synthase